MLYPRPSFSGIGSRGGHEVSNEEWWRHIRGYWRVPVLIPDTELPAATVFARSAWQTLDPRPQGFKVRIANRPGIFREAQGLLNRRYNDRGYVGQELTVSDKKLTIAIYEDGEIIGTLTVTLDTGLNLSCEEFFPAETADLRQRGAVLCEFTKLATGDAASAARSLATMFHVAFVYAHRIHKASHVVIEVNPKHVSFYTRVIGFQQHGLPRHNARVNAPAVLLTCCFSDIESRMVRSFKLGERSESRSRKGDVFYSHSLSPGEEEKIRTRLLRIINPGFRSGAKNWIQALLRPWFR